MKKTIQKFIWVMIKMKLACMVVMLGFSSLNAEVWSQQRKIDLSFEQVNFAQLFEMIQQKTSLKFVFNHEDVQSFTVTDNFSGKTVQEILDIAFRGKPLKYEILKDHIVVSRVTGQAPQVKTMKIQGNVKDEKGVTLPGVSIIIKGTSLGTATNVDGDFTLEVPEQPNTVLVFSFVGLMTKEVKVNAQQTAYNVVMAVDNQTLDDVVCTGYQTLNKINTTGAFSSIAPEEIRLRGSIGLDRLLEGTVPGLTVYKNDIRVRGGSSINAGTKPLYIVDGFEVEDLPENMDLVERITVLKDAAAAAVWGARAANGVIVIETKKGKKGKATLSYSGNFRVSAKPDYDDLNRADGSMLTDVDLEAFDKETIFGAIWEGSHNGYSPSYGLIFDYESGKITRPELETKLKTLGSISNKKQIEDKLLRNAFTQNHNLTLLGGSEKLTYFLSGNYKSSTSSYQGDKSREINIMSKNSYELIPQLTLRADINAIYGNTDHGYDVSDAINSILPYQLLYDEQTGSRINDYSSFNVVENQRLMELGYKDNGFNILNEIDLANNKTEKLSLRTKFGFDINIIDGLKVSADYQYEKSNTERKDIRSENTYSVRKDIINWFTTEKDGALVYNVPNGGVLDLKNSKGSTHAFKAGVSLNRSFGEDNKHYVNFIGGFELRKHVSESTSNRKLGYNDDLQTWQVFDQASMAKTGINWWNGDRHTYDASRYDNFTFNDSREVSYYGSAVYTYDSRYTLSGTFRIDESNLYGAAKKYRRNPLWSVGASWNVQEEDFFHSEIIDRLVPRVTYGLMGNFDRSGSTTPLLVGKRLFNSAAGFYYTRVDTPPNPALRWERTKMLNVGFEIGLFNRINLSAEYYNKKSFDLLGNALLDPTVGFSQMKINAADMTNRGIEVMLNAGLIRTSDFGWNMNFVFSYNKNKIVKNKLADGNPDINRPRGTIQFVEGYAREAIWSYRWAGLDENGNPQTYDAENNKTKDSELASLECSGTYLPRYNGSLSTDFKYKGVTLMLSFVYNFGHVTRIEYPTMNPHEGASMSKLVAKRWRNPGDEKLTDIPALMTWEQSFDGRERLAQYSSNSIRNANFIRLREVLVNYELPKEWMQKTPFARASLTAQANTLWMWAKNKEGFDPEAIDPVHGTLSLSEPASFTFGVRLEF